MALTLRTDDQLEQALAALAESEGLSRQEIIRRAVLERYERSSHRARVEDAGLLDAACARPRSTVFGEDAYPTLEEKAAALLHLLVRNHALVDGNKRLGWLATAVFLDLNGHPPRLSDDEAFSLVMSVAEGILDVDEIAGRLSTE